MPRITKVYTRTGDDGTTALGIKTRVAKDSARVEAYGTVDELNSFLGMVLAGGVVEALRDPLERVQNDLFHLGSDLCVPETEKESMPVPRIEERHVAMLESWMDAWSRSSSRSPTSCSRAAPSRRRGSRSRARCAGAPSGAW